MSHVDITTDTPPTETARDRKRGDIGRRILRVFAVHVVQC